MFRGFIPASPFNVNPARQIGSLFTTMTALMACRNALLALVHAVAGVHNLRNEYSPSDSSSLFKGRRFDSSIIILCVRQTQIQDIASLIIE